MAAEDNDVNKNSVPPINTPNPTSPQPESPKSFGFTTPEETKGVSPQPSPPKVGKNRQKLFIITGVALLLIAALGFGWWYYNNTQRVLADALANTLSADTGGVKGKLEFTSKDQSRPIKIAMDFDVEGDNDNAKIDAKSKITYGAADLNIDTSILATKNDAFFKINNAKQLSDLASSLSGDAKAVVEFYKPLIEKLDNKWVKIDGQSQEVTNCSSALRGFTLSQADEKNLKKIFKANQFVKGKKAGGGPFSKHHFELSLDEKTSEKFMDEAIKLDSFKKIKDECHADQTVEDAKEEISQEEGDKPVVKAELWATRWSHEPTKFALTVEDKEAKFSFTTSIDLGKKVNISAPASAESLSGILKDFQEQTIQGLTGQTAPQEDLQGTSL